MFSFKEKESKYIEGILNDWREVMLRDNECRKTLQGVDGQVRKKGLSYESYRYVRANCTNGTLYYNEYRDPLCRKLVFGWEEKSGDCFKWYPAYYKCQTRTLEQQEEARLAEIAAKEEEIRKQK